MFNIVKQSTSLAPARLGAVRCFAAGPVIFKKAAPKAPTVSKKRDPSLPTAPKGSASPYALFVKSWFPENKSKHVNSEGKIDLPTVATAMSTAWGALTMDDKQSYYDKAKELKKAFDAEYKTWYNGLDAATLKAIEKETGKKVSPPGGKRAKKLADKERPGNPGVPLTAFFEYMKAFRAAEGKDLSVSESGKQGGQNWREMSEDAKQKYRDLALANKAKYVEWQKSL